jgi:lycopene beta-cyclase
MRPATGYAFLQIQRQVAYCRGQATQDPHYSKATLWLDRLFLAVIKRQPALCPRIFMDMVTRLPVQTFLAFMNNRLSLKVWLLVILSVPKKPFLQQLFSFYRKTTKQ